MLDRNYTLGQSIKIFVSNVNASPKAPTTKAALDKQVDRLTLPSISFPFLCKYPSLVNKMTTVVLRMEAKNRLGNMDFLSPRHSNKLLSL